MTKKGFKLVIPCALQRQSDVAQTRDPKPETFSIWRAVGRAPYNNALLNAVEDVFQWDAIFPAAELAVSFQV